MSGIYHSWNGTVLTVTSDSGTSSADLQGAMGIRGPQGVAGVIPVEQLNQILANTPVDMSYESDEVPYGEFTGCDWVKYLDGRVECTLHLTRQVVNEQEIAIFLPFEINNFQEEIVIYNETAEGTTIELTAETHNFRELTYQVYNDNYADSGEKFNVRIVINITGYWRGV